MADLNTVRQIFQRKIQDRTPQYAHEIESTIALSWATLAKMADWWFLDQPEPITLSVAANIYRYSIPKKANEIGRMLYIANAKNRVVWRYKSRYHYQLYRTGHLIRDVDGSVDDSTGTIQTFTVIGIGSGGQVRIEIWPIPAQSGTYYLHFREPGTLSNLDKLPDAWVKVLVHLGMSLIAPPEEVAPTKWLALTYREDELFHKWLHHMLRYEGVAAEDEDKELAGDPPIVNEIEEINAL